MGRFDCHSLSKKGCLWLKILKIELKRPVSPLRCLSSLFTKDLPDLFPHFASIVLSLRHVVLRTFEGFFTSKQVSIVWLCVDYFLPCCWSFLNSSRRNFGSREQEKFQCTITFDIQSDERNNQFLQDKCYQKYDLQFNSRLPLWGVVLVKSALILTVSLFYSCWLQTALARVVPRFNVLEAEFSREKQHPRRIFRLYLSCLVARLALTILFVVLHNSVFFPFIFPTEFYCVLSLQPNVSCWNSEFKGTSPSFHCPNSLAKDKTVVSMLVLMLNIFCLFLVLSVEIIYLVRKKRIHRNFTVDIEFYSYYFFKRASIRRVRIYMQKLTSVNTEKALIGHCENRLLLDDIFVDVALQMNNGELIYRYDDLYLPTASKVLVVGAPGRGKSLLCQKLSRDWSKTPLDSFDFAFLFKFSWFNSEETSNMSRKGLLNRGACSEGIVETVFRQLVDNPVKVLLIFDGLNEFKHLQSCTENNEAGYENSVTAKIPVSAL